MISYDVIIEVGMTFALILPVPLENSRSTSCHGFLE